MSRHQPVGHTCPDIDNCAKWLKIALGNIEYAIDLLEHAKIQNDLGGAEDNVYNAINALEEAKNYVDFGGVLEELRESNSALRDWAYELRSELEKLETA